MLSLLPALIDELRVTPFQVDSFGIELVAHGDGAFYKRHIDTHKQRLMVNSDESVS